MLINLGGTVWVSEDQIRYLDVRAVALVGESQPRPLTKAQYGHIVQQLEFSRRASRRLL